MEGHLHHEEQTSGSTVLRDVVIGMSDGLTVPFALAAGLSAAVDSTSIIVIAGIAEIIAGSIAMALGGYFSVKSEQEHSHHHNKEIQQPTSLKTHHAGNTKKFFANLGLSEELQIQASEEIEKDKEKWIAFMTQYEPVVAKQSTSKYTRSAISIGLSYVIGGLVPLSPYFFIDDPITALKYSSALTLVGLFILGWLKGSITGANSFGMAIRLSLIGATAAAAAYGVAKIFVGA